MINNISQRLESLSGRSLNIIRHIGWSMIFKLGSILTSFIMVPLAIAYLGTEDYGIWLTISSVLTWFLLFDIGLGNGLRNKFAEAKALGNDVDAKAFVSTAYFTIGLISGVLFCLMMLVNEAIDWAEVLNTDPDKTASLKLLVPVVFGFFTMQLVSKLIINIYQADQHHSIQDKSQFLIQAIALMGVYYLLQSGSSSLLYFASVYTASPVIVLLIINAYAFFGNYRQYKPDIKLLQKKHLAQVTAMGVKFFILQLSAVIIFATDNFIISHLFSPAEVTPYQVTIKYFSVIIMVFSIIVTPYWSAITNAAAQNDYPWIERSIIGLKKIWLISVAGAILLTLIFYPVLQIWVGDVIAVPIELVMQALFFVCLQSRNMIYTFCLNGLSKVKLQLIVSVICMLANVPLSIFLARNMEMGVSGILLATNLCLVIYILTRHIQYNRIIHGTATGIWAQ